MIVLKHIKYSLKLYLAIFLLILGFGANLSSVYAQNNPNTITFDNQAGEYALVKLIGPTMQAVEVPNGESRTVNVSAGEYYILTRYGDKPETYTYAEGDPFNVDQTTTQYSKITITLYPVIDGNYRTHPVSKEQFELAGPQDMSSIFANNGKELIEAASEGYAAKVEALLSKGADVNHQYLDNGATALYIASQKGYAAIVKKLLSKGANVNLRVNNGATALIVATGNGHEGIVKALLEKGADVNLKANNGGTALIVASKNGSEEIVKALLENGANVDFQKNNGASALYMASQEGYAAIVKKLLAKGADVNLRVNNGATALIVATQEGYAAIVKKLLANGANVDLQDNNNGATALFVASMKGNLEVVKMLLSKGANVNIKANGGWVALSVASSNGHESVVKMLLSNGADVNYQKDDGWTALIVASKNGSEGIVKALLENGANIFDLKSNNGTTALMKASQNGHEEVVKMLLAKGADVSRAKHSSGATALSVAKTKRIAQLLKEGGEKPESLSNFKIEDIQYINDRLEDVVTHSSYSPNDGYLFAIVSLTFKNHSNTNLTIDIEQINAFDKNNSIFPSQGYSFFYKNQFFLTGFYNISGALKFAENDSFGFKKIAFDGNSFELTGIKENTDIKLRLLFSVPIGVGVEKIEWYGEDILYNK